MAEPDARQFLAALAGKRTAETESRAAASGADSYRDVIDEATAAMADFESAAAFLDDNDLNELEAAVERAEADLSVRAEDGAAALESLRHLRAAAVEDGQFQSGLSSPLGAGDLADSR